MNLRFDIAKAVGAASTWGLRHVFDRPAANFPGKVGLYADPHLIADLRPRIREGVISVVGTNGKTTVTNLIADALEACGKQVACNRTGANLDSGVATAMLHVENADWGVFESDELWFARIAGDLRPDYVVLLNLFRDQLDRMGEIALIQERIAGALEAAPNATLVYNADDPLCQAIAERVDNERIPFGIAEHAGAGTADATGTAAAGDAGMCQRCDATLEYDWRQYGQLGSYWCPACGFARPAPAYTAGDISTGPGGTQVTLRGGALDQRFDEPFSGTYTIYNMLAAYAAADLCGVPFAAFEQAVRLFDPRNGRLQYYEVDGSPVLLNLAKNPTGFNQNLDIALGGDGPRAVAFFVNDREADGRDVSWLWDIDFERLATDGAVSVFAGGLRALDVQVRLKHAGLDAPLVDGARDFLERARAANANTMCFIVANYTALPTVKSELDRLAEGWDCLTGAAGNAVTDAGAAPASHGHLGWAGGTSAAPTDDRGEDPFPLGGEKLKIVHLYPQLLNLYGDRGNVRVLANRAHWRGLDVEVACIGPGEPLDLADADIVFLGGGPDREQRLTSRELIAQAGVLRRYVETDGVLLAICGGFQILGREWIIGGEAVPGLGILDAVTKRADGNARNRLVGDVVLESPLAAMPVVGYENHAGRTYLGAGCRPFGVVSGRCGHGNNDADGTDGALYRNVVGTYLHGPLLAKNPAVADRLIARALARRGLPTDLAPLDDTAERAANELMRDRL